MKLYKLSYALLLGLATLTSCEDKLDLINPNQQTTGTYGNTADDLEECVVGTYKRIRMEGSYARVGYTYDLTRGDEVWNSSQTWNYLPVDDYNTPVTNEETIWPWREWYYVLNVCNFITSKIEQNEMQMTDKVKAIKGQALFFRGLSYYNLVGYYQNPPLITNYSDYSTLEGLYCTNNTQDEVLDQIEADFKEAMELLPSKEKGGEWAKGRATNAAAAGYYARVLMFRHKFPEALAVLKDILSKEDNGAQKYGKYSLVKNFGDNFREGSAYENNEESLFEVQFLDYGTQGTDDEWTPVNTSINATQAHAVESNFCPGVFGGWADLSATPWLYELFKAERTKEGKLDPRLYWTLCTYETDWEGFEFGNVAYGTNVKEEQNLCTNNNFGGIPIAKYTNMRTGIYDKVVTGLRCGINLRMLRYADILLLAAECENEVNGPTQQAINWINRVRERANLADLSLSDFNTADKLFEQIANVERPKEFGCEFGRGFDLIRWGFFYDAGRLQQMKEHNVARLHNYRSEDNTISIKASVDYSMIGSDPELKSGFDSYRPGHEYLPISQVTMNENPNLKGNSANDNTDNSGYFFGKGWKVRPVTSLDK